MFFPLLSFKFLSYRDPTVSFQNLVWYIHLFKNFPEFVVIHIVKGFGVVNKAKVDVSLEAQLVKNPPAMQETPI